MDLQRQNWETFCRHHLGDWHGTWTQYTPDGSVVESFQCIRSFQLSEDGNQIQHQNHYTYPDGRQETQSFGPYLKPVTRSLFLENSFSWGSITVEAGANFGFETGFRYGDRRVSVATIYQPRTGWQTIMVITEHLNSFASCQHPSAETLPNSNWQGTRKAITPDWVVSSPEATTWQSLEELGPDYLTLHVQEGIAVSMPRQIDVGELLWTAVDWQVLPTLQYRGTRHFDESGFTQFTLEVFSLSS